jgi:hypothetical protein
MVRSVLAVFAGEVCRLVLLIIFVLSVLIPAYSAAGGIRGGPFPDTPGVRTVGMFFTCWILLAVGPVGGYVCAMVAGRRYLAHGAALCIVALGIYAQEVYSTPTATQPPLPFIVATFIVIPIGIMFGAYLYLRRVSRRLRVGPSFIKAAPK